MIDKDVHPTIDPATWRLKVYGAGLRDPDGIALSYDDLLRLPARTVVSAVECAGNDRSLFAEQQGTPARGTAWKLGAIGVARWRGVPSSEVVQRAGLPPPRHGRRHAAGARRTRRRRRRRPGPRPPAADRTGQTQPDTVPFNDNGYQFWAVARHPVTAG